MESIGGIDPAAWVISYKKRCSGQSAGRFDSFWAMNCGCVGTEHWLLVAKFAATCHHLGLPRLLAHAIDRWQAFALGEFAESQSLCR